MPPAKPESLEEMEGRGAAREDRMVNRLTTYFEQPQDGPHDQDYWVVSSPTAWYCVDEPTAERIQEELERRRPPRWLRFVDLFGSAVRVRSRDIDQVVESTIDQRAAGRAFRQARQREETGDRPPWDECD